MLKGRSVLEPADLSLAETEEILELASRIMENPAKYAHCADGMLMATLFYEPSTRTRLSFTAAMQRLGGQVLGFADPSYSSDSKGESIADTIKTVSCYADIIVMRHPKEGAPRVAAGASELPVINAGDGGHQHPSQTLTDLLTIRKCLGKKEDFTIGICGDLKFGRTVHSLIKALSRYENIKLRLISPDELILPEYVRKHVIVENNMDYKEYSRLEAVLPELDVLYMTRVQKERFFNEEDYIRLKDFYILDENKMQLAKDNMIVMHPLPRVNEIAKEIDNDPRACYFKQTRIGMFVRMALVIKLLGIDIQ